MRIQLLLANQEVELNNNVQIPLNKSYQNLWNPTDIIVDYSKNISIPMTIINNRILGNAYRLDRTIIENAGVDNIGIYLDPTKKIPFQLLYNGQSLMEGYAKFVSANYSEKNKVYNMNLFGSLGAYFLKMKNIVTSYDKLTEDQLLEGGDAYVLNDHIGHPALNSDYILKSWMRINNNINDFSDPSITDQDIIGFAPSYRGYYGLDFKPNSIQVNDAEIMNIADLLEKEWARTYCLKYFLQDFENCTESQQETALKYAEGLRASEVVGDGLKDYQMGEYRAYHQRPFIYFNKLLYMFQEKSKTLTGYDLLLDDKWFNNDNPYWTKLVYTLNFLEDMDELPSSSNTGTSTAAYQLYQNPTDNVYCKATHTQTIIPNSEIVKFKFGSSWTEFEFDNRFTQFKPYGVWANKQSAIVYEIKFKYGETSQTIYYWSDIGGYGYKPNLSYLNDSNKILSPAWWDVNASNGNYITPIRFGVWGSIPDYVLSIPPEHSESELEISITTKIYSTGSPFMINTAQYGSSQIPVWNYVQNVQGKDEMFGIEYKTTYSNSVNIGLNTLYLEEKPLFDVILQYTKMYGLLWKVDDINKTITICRRSTYFDHTSVEDWNDKLDRSKDYTIEPLTFDTKYVNFNYEDVDGFKYDTYKDKYGSNYGSYKLNTSYDFDAGDTDLFSDINPSIVSNRSFVTYPTLRDWYLAGSILPTYDSTNRMEAASSDDEQGLNVSSWYFRNENTPITEGVYITDDSDLMIANKEYCYYTKAWLEEMHLHNAPNVKKSYLLPNFGVTTYKSTGEYYGCLFNCPKEDYTLNKEVSKAKGSYIYDNFWKDYIDERYNVQNKKLTAYFNLTPYDYLNFDFNKLVTVDNQLFMINKIFDYDLNSSATTKCELVQISDLSVYTNDKVEFEYDPNQPESPEDEYTMTFNVTPSDASVKLNGTYAKSITGPIGTEVKYIISKEGFITKEGTLYIIGNETVDIEILVDPNAMFVFAIDPDPSDAKIVLNGIESKTISVKYGTIVAWEVSKEGYHTKTGELEVTKDITIPVWLTEDYKDVLTFTIIPDPSDAEVIINSTPTTSIQTEEGAYITWIVRKEGYTTRNDTFQIYESQTLDVKLEEKGIETAVFTINPTPSDATVYMYVRSDSDSPSEYAGTEVEGVGTQSVTVAVGDWISYSVRRDGYELLSGMYQMQTSEDYTYDAVLEELGAITYDLLTYPDKDQTINGDAQTLTFKVSSRKMIPREDGSGSDVEFLDINYSNAVNCTVTKQDNIAGDAKDFVVSISENNTGADRYSTFTVTQNETNDTIDFSIKQRTNTYKLEQYSLIEAISYAGGDGSVEVQSLKNNNAHPFTTNNVSISGIDSASIKSVENVSERGEGVYRINFSIPKNSTSEDRIAIITVTQPGSNYTLDIEVNQVHEAPATTEKAIVKGHAALEGNTVSYSVYFDATAANGGTLKNVVFQVRDDSGVSGNLISSKSEGDITVTKGSKSQTYTGDLSAGNLIAPWFHVYYDNALKYSSQCLQEDIGPINEGE